MDLLGAESSAQNNDLAWDADLDSFLDDYLKEVGPDAQDPFGNFQLEVPLAFAGTALPRVPPAECAPQQQQPAEQPTTLTADFQAASLGPSSEAAAKPAGKGGQRRGAQAKTAKNGEPLDAKSIRKQLALQEKNRRAQRRFRERQKQKVEELSSQVEALTAQLTAVLAEKSGLESRTNVLENVLAMREKQLEAAARDGAAALDVKPATSGGGASDASASTDAADGEGEEGLAAAFAEDLTLSVKEGAPTTLTASQVKGMTPMELAKYYKAYVNELAGCLVETNGQPPCPERIKRLVDEVCLLCTRVALCNPAGVKHFTLTKVVEDASGQHADDRVPQMVRALSISPQQRSQLSQLRRLFLQKLAKIVNDRKDINALLLNAVPGGTSHRQMAVRYLSAHDALRKLRDNMREEHILVLDFVSTIFKHVFSAPQVAQFMIHSFPYTPDCLALSTWVSAEDGDAEALSMLASEAQSKQQAAAAQPGAAAAPSPQAVPPVAAAAAVTAGLPAGVPPAAMFALPDQQAMFANPAAAMFAAGQMPLLPNGQALIGNVAVSAAHLMPFGPGAPALMQLPAGSFSSAGSMVNNMNGLLKPGTVVLPAGMMAKTGCYPPELAAGMLPVSPHVVTMTSSSR